jgi:hypothetical protein
VIEHMGLVFWEGHWRWHGGRVARSCAPVVLLQIVVWMRLIAIITQGLLLRLLASAAMLGIGVMSDCAKSN